MKSGKEIHDSIITFTTNVVNLNIEKRNEKKRNEPILCRIIGRCTLLSKYTTVVLYASCIIAKTMVVCISTFSRILFLNADMSLLLLSLNIGYNFYVGRDLFSLFCFCTDTSFRLTCLCDFLVSLLICFDYFLLEIFVFSFEL